MIDAKLAGAYWQMVYSSNKPNCAVCNDPFIMHLKDRSTELRVHNINEPCCTRTDCHCSGYIPVAVKNDTLSRVQIV